MRKINNKKAAFEMSIGTIVIIVLAMSMLILGLVLTKKIMCSGIVLTDQIDQAVENQVSSMFEGQEYGVKCMGEAGNEVTLGGGGRRQVICIVNTDVGGTYTFSNFNLEKTAGTAVTDDMMVSTETNAQTVQPGKKTIVVAVLDIPQKVPSSGIKLSFDASDNLGNTETHTLYIDLEPSSTVGSAIC